MSRSQQYLDSLLSGVPLEELAVFESRAAFQHIKERITGTEDVTGELKALYRVNNFSELALQLLWIAQRSEQDPTMLEPTVEEQTLVLSLFRHAIGDTVEVVEEQPAVVPMDTTEPTVEPEAIVTETYTPEPVVEPEIISEPIIEQAPEPVQVPEPEPTQEASTGFGFAEETPQQELPAAEPFGMPSEPEPASAPSAEADPFSMGSTTEAPAEADPFGMASTTEEPSGFGPTTESAPAAEPFGDFPSTPSAEPTPEAMADFPSGESAPPAAVPQQAVGIGEALTEMQFAKLVERFAEALSSGAADRDAVKDEMLNACAAILKDGSGAPDDYRNFCQVLTEFISYIYENQFVDDIRVMNLVSNVPDPVLAWAKADAGSRPGMMNAAYDTLREFKSLFE